MFKNILKNFNLIVDGRGYAGKTEELNPPKLNLKLEEYRGGGMDAPIQIDVGMDALEADFTALDFDANILSLYGVSVGRRVPFRFKGILQDNDGGAVTPIEVAINGKVVNLDMGTWKSGETAKLKCMIKDIQYFRLIHGTETLIEIDIPNGIRKINGVDQLAGISDALGTSGTINISRLIDTATNQNRSAARAAASIGISTGIG